MEPADDYTLSVDDARTRLIAQGIEKSPDTIQRYCRNGDLECAKLGILRRYFITEKSFEALVKKLQVDAPAPDSTQLHETDEPDAVQVHEGAAPKNSNHDRTPHTAAPEGTQVHAGEAPEVPAAVLSAKLEAAEIQIDELQKTNAFLMEEVRDARNTRRDVTTIAERMLGTLETMVVGGRLTRRTDDNASAARPAQADPVHGSEQVTREPADAEVYNDRV